jgi:alanyl-tRNA synthetase
MTVSEIRQKYFEFFKARGHHVVPSAPLVPENDPTTLFTGSGMQPMLPYLLGASHPLGTRIADSQKSFRAQDIEEVGDNRHTTFFEMLGNWSFGDYFKQEQVPWMFEFLTEVVGIDPNRLYITCFIGDEKYGIPKDTEAAELWQKLFASKGISAAIADIGSEANGYARGMKPGERIFYYDGSKNWWNRGKTGPETTAIGDPCGPDSEMFYDFGTPHDPAWGAECHLNCDCGRFMEIGNNVFMAYRKVSADTFEPLAKPNIDHGSGLERIAAAAKGNPDVFLIDTMQAVIIELAAASGKNYNDLAYQKSFRIIADHARGATFMIGDGVLPSNTEQGYFARRLIRRAIRHLDKLGVGEGTLVKIVSRVIDAHKDQYPELQARHLEIYAAIQDEEQRFRKTLKDGLKEFERGANPFILFTTYGFPIELTQELAAEQGKTVDVEAFKQEMEKHQALSRAGAEHKFKGGLADSGEVTTMLHTSTHLMLAALRKYLGDHVHQAGSNITAERTRFDFTHSAQVPRAVLDQVEAYVNEAIQKKSVVEIIQMPKDEAKAMGVEGSFWEKYPDVVNVYQVKAPDGTVYSRELCGGPHVENTGMIVGTFKIVKEEASSAGVRRVKGVLV